jgi:hypothetical protein
MALVPEWERLADALKRVVATGISEHDAQVSLCRAISERKIRVALWLGIFERGEFRLLHGIAPNVGLIMPADITPQDFDWSESRPLKPWRNDTMGGMFRDWHRDRIELYSADVTRVLVTRTTPQQSVAAKPAERKANQIPGRTQPARERAKKALDAIYPTAIPKQSAVPNKVLLAKVNEWLKANRELAVKLDSVLRAAGRRKDKKGRSRHG